MSGSLSCLYAFPPSFVVVAFLKSRYEVFKLLSIVKVDFLGVHFGVGGKIAPSLKLVRTTIETDESTNTYVVSENIPFSMKIPLILLMAAFFLQKISIFLAKIVSLLKAIV